MKINRLILLIVFFLIIINGQAQDLLGYKPALSVGYAYTEGHFVQVGAIFGKNYGNIHVPSYGFGGGVELGAIDGKFALGSKAFAEYNLFLATIRLGMINYTWRKQNDLRLLPEVGLTAFGYASITYGYTVPFKENDISEIGRHRFALTINLFRDSN